MPKPEVTPGKGVMGDDMLNDPASLLGLLRSELDDTDASLPPVFADMLSRFLQLRQQVREGQVDRHDAARKFAGLRAIDLNGYEWTLGAQTGGWYRRAIGGQWVSSLPPLSYGRVDGPGGRPADGAFPDVGDAAADGQPPGAGQAGQAPWDMPVSPGDGPPTLQPQPDLTGPPDAARLLPPPQTA